MVDAAGLGLALAGPPPVNGAKDTEQSKGEGRCDAGLLGGHHDADKFFFGFSRAGHRVYLSTIVGNSPGRQGVGPCPFPGESSPNSFAPYTCGLCVNGSTNAADGGFTR